MTGEVDLSYNRQAIFFIPRYTGRFTEKFMAVEKLFSSQLSIKIQKLTYCSWLLISESNFFLLSPNLKRLHFLFFSSRDESKNCLNIHGKTT